MPESHGSPHSANSTGRVSIIERIEREAGVPGLTNILADRIPPTDLQSLLLEVYSLRAKKREPRDLLVDHVSNRFVRPSTLDPVQLLIWDRIAFSLLPKNFQSIELSPVCPFGTASVLSPINQDWSLSTVRNTEVVADSTNVLGIECAVRRRSQENSSSGVNPVHLAASHRLLRGQRYGNGPGAKQHFKVFTLCSAGRDIGNLRFETSALRVHIEFFLTALGKFLGQRAPLRVTISDFASEAPRTVVQSGLVEKLQRAHRKVEIGIDQDRKQARGYYRQLCFKIYASSPNGREHELVDGGDVDWTAKLLNNGKERLVISGCGSERLCELYIPAGRRSRV